MSHVKAEGALARIVWQEGAFVVECVGSGPAMELRIRYGRYVMAEEPVASAQAAWQRATDICRVLAAGDMDAYERGLA